MKVCNNIYTTVLKESNIQKRNIKYAIHKWQIKIIFAKK